jgi:putative addiction module component (TIGR02574 family)
MTEEESDRLWAAEAERRYGAYKAGQIDAVPAEEVFARLRAPRIVPSQDPERL